MLRHSRHIDGDASPRKDAHHPKVTQPNSSKDLLLNFIRDFERRVSLLLCLNLPKRIALSRGFLLGLGLIFTFIFASGDQVSRAQSLEEGLIVWLQLDEGTGITASDSSGNNNAGILRGGDWILGRFGNAVDLINPSQNNTDPDWIEIAHNENQNLQNQVTLAAWVKPVQLTEGAGIITKGENITSYAMRLTDSGQVRFTANFGEPFGWQGAGNWESFTSIGTNEWHHIAVTYDGANVRFFLDGVKDDNKPATDLIFGRASQPIFIGADLPNDDQLFDGAVDDVRIYNRALTTGEMQKLALRPNQPPTLSLPETQTNNEGDSIALAIQASDPEGQALTFSANGLPNGLTLDATTGLISGIIESGASGTYSVDVEVSDPQNNKASGSFLWIVNAPAPTNTPTEAPTETPAETPTEIPTNTPTETWTPTQTPTQTPTPTFTPTNTPTSTQTPTGTLTPSATPTETSTSTPTAEPTATSTPTSTFEPTATPEPPLPTPTQPSELTGTPSAVPPTPMQTATATPTNGRQPIGEIIQTFSHFEDVRLDSRISTGDRILFQTTITNTGTITLTDVHVSQEANSELTLVPNSVWIVQNSSSSGMQLPNAVLPLNISTIPAGNTISVLYIMEVRLNRLIQTDNIESVAFLQAAGQDNIYASPVLIPVVRPPVGLSGSNSTLLFLPYVNQ